MGGIKKSKKKYEVPRKRWDKTRIEEEKQIIKTYGLKNKKEFRGAQTFIRKKRKMAKNLLAVPLETRLKREKELIQSLSKYKILPENATLDDVLSLQAQEILEKRLQTVVWRKNLARTPSQARQFIVHGHIAIENEKITAPNYLVPECKAESISFFGNKKMRVEPPKPEKKQRIKKKFEEVAKEEQVELGETKEQKQEPKKETITEVKNDSKAAIKGITKVTAKEKAELKEPPKEVNNNAK